MNDLTIQSKNNFQLNEEKKNSVDLKETLSTNLQGHSINEVDSNQKKTNKNSTSSNWNIKKIGLLAVGVVATLGSLLLAYRFSRSAPQSDLGFETPNQNTLTEPNTCLREMQKTATELEIPLMKLNPPLMKLRMPVVKEPTFLEEKIFAIDESEQISLENLEQFSTEKTMTNPQKNNWWKWIGGGLLAVMANKYFNLTSSLGMGVALPSQNFGDKVVQEAKGIEVEQMKNLSNGVNKKITAKNVPKGYEKNHLEFDCKEIEVKEYQFIDFTNKDILLNDNIYYSRIKVSRNDKRKIEGTLWKSNSLKDVGPDKIKCLISLNGNGETFQTKNTYLHQLASNHQCIVACCNYSGVMNSEGRTTSPEDSKKDIMALYEALLKEGILPQNICFIGHSFGGSVGGKLLEETDRRNEQIKGIFHFTFNTMLNVVNCPSEKSFIPTSLINKGFGKILNVHVSTSDILKKLYQKESQSKNDDKKLGDKKLSERICIIQSEIDELIIKGSRLIDDLPTGLNPKVIKPLLGHCDDPKIYQGLYYEEINKLLDIDPNFDASQYVNKTTFEIKQNILNNYRHGLDVNKLLDYAKQVWDTNKDNSNKNLSGYTICSSVKVGIRDLFEKFSESIAAKQTRPSTAQELFNDILPIIELKSFIVNNLNTEKRVYTINFPVVDACKRQHRQRNSSNLKYVNDRLNYLIDFLNIVKKSKIDEIHKKDLIGNIESQMVDTFAWYFKLKNPFTSMKTLNCTDIKQSVIRCSKIVLNVKEYMAIAPLFKKGLKQYVDYWINELKNNNVYVDLHDEDLKSIYFSISGSQDIGSLDEKKSQENKPTIKNKKNSKNIPFGNEIIQKNTSEQNQIDNNKIYVELPTFVDVKKKNKELSDNLLRELDKQKIKTYAEQQEEIKKKKELELKMQEDEVENLFKNKYKTGNQHQFFSMNYSEFAESAFDQILYGGNEDLKQQAETAYLLKQQNQIIKKEENNKDDK